MAAAAGGGDNVPDHPFKRPRVDAALETGQLCSPVTFTQVLPRPRLMPLVVKSRPINPYSIHATGVASAGAGAGAGAGSSSASAAGGSSGSHHRHEPEVLLPRPPQSVHLDDYLTLVGNMYYTGVETGRSNKDWAVLRRTTLGLLTSPVREPNVWDKWSPLEIAKFESALCMNGKHFHVIAKSVLGGSKTTAEVIEFYYVWKQGKNYPLWKASFKEPDKLPDA